MSRGAVLGVVAGVIIVAVLIVLLANVIRGQDVSWGMTYTTRRHRDNDADLRQDDDERDDDG